MEGIKQQEGMRKTLSKKAFYKLIPQRPSLEANVKLIPTTCFFVLCDLIIFLKKKKKVK